ncbi:MAG: hypothetical protein ACYTGZ_04605 [Planctomycetota bacterium]
MRKATSRSARFSTRIRGGRALLALLCLLFLHCGAARAESFDGWLPPRTLLHFSIADANRLRRRLAAGPLPAILARPEARDALAGLQGFLVGRGRDPDATATLLDHPTGAVAIALWDASQAKSEEFEIDGALLADVRGNEESFRKAWSELLRAEEETRAVTLGSEHAGEVKIHTRAMRIRGESIRSAWFLHGGAFGFAPGARALRDLIDRRRSRGPSLLGDEDYARFMKRASADADLRLWISPRLWGPTAAPELQEGLRASGLDSLRGVGLQLSFVPEGVFSRLFLDVRGRRKGLLAIFREPIDALGPPPWLPPRLAGAVTFHLDHARMLRELLRVADAIRPGLGERMAAEAARLKRDQGLDLAGDLVAALGPRTTLAALPVEPGLRRLAIRRQVDPELFGLVLVQEVMDEKSMQRVVAALLRMIGPLPFRDFDGIRVHIAPGRDGGALALFDGHLVLARHPEFIRAMIVRRSGKRLRLADDPMWQRAQRYAPRRRSVFSYTSPAPPLLDAASEKDPGTQRLLRAAGQPTAGWWRRYHDITVFSMTDAGEALEMTWFTGLRSPDVGAPDQEDTEK